MGSLIAGMQKLTCDMWDLSADQGSNPGLLHWELRVSYWTTREVPAVTFYRDRALKDVMKVKGRHVADPTLA